MENAAQSTVETLKPATSQGTEVVLPINLSEISDFSDLPVEDQGQQRRNAMLRPICEDGVTIVWNDITPLLEFKGGYAGNSNFAHGIICERVYRAAQDRFESIGNVTLAEIWPLVHAIFKKRNLVFERGFVVGKRQVNFV